MKGKEFTQRWINTILMSVGEYLDAETGTRLMEACGRECARSEAVSAAVQVRGDIGKFLDKMRGWIGKQNVAREGDTVQLVYNKCFCPLEIEVPQDLAQAFCLCSCGWLKEMFETVTGSAVRVDLVSSIKRGADKCRFIVRLS